MSQGGMIECALCNEGVSCKLGIFKIKCLQQVKYMFFGRKRALKTINELNRELSSASYERQKMLIDLATDNEKIRQLNISLNECQKKAGEFKCEALRMSVYKAFYELTLAGYECVILFSDKIDYCLTIREMEKDGYSKHDTSWYCSMILMCRRKTPNLIDAPNG